jgi:radical SAM superfamily enzyme YgiQ (UPF0313 family)
MAEKTIVFLEINSSYSHSMPGYCMLRALAEREAPECCWKHVEATIKTPPEEILRKLEACKADILLATAYIFNLDFLLKICAELKEHSPKLQIFPGGPCFLGNNEDFLRENPYISGTIRGDESSLPGLLKGHDFGEIPGLCYLDDKGQYRDNQTAEYKGELDSLPSPYQAGLIHQGKPFYQLESSRGCGGACVFCTSSRSRGVKYHSPERVKNDLRALHEQGYREIRLIDRTFNENPERALELLKLFAEDFADMRFHLEIHPGRLTPKLLAQLTKAEKGSLHLEAGIQSFDPAVLKEIRRPASSAAENGLRSLTSLKNLEIHTDLIAGLPGQTSGSLLRDINKMLELSPDEIQLEILKILPGTALRENPPPGMEYSRKVPWQVLKTIDMTAQDLQAALLYSYIIDSWHNPPALQNVFRFAFRRIADFFVKFSVFIAPYCELDSGKLPLEKRFELFEEFLAEHDKKALELCRFAKLAAGFRCDGTEIQKYSATNGEILIWQRPGMANPKIKRCIIFTCSFNAADFWLDSQSQLEEQPEKYIFKLHYGRHPAAIVKQLKG